MKSPMMILVTASLNLMSIAALGAEGGESINSSALIVGAGAHFVFSTPGCAYDMDLHNCSVPGAGAAGLQANVMYRRPIRWFGIGFIGSVDWGQATASDVNNGTAVFGRTALEARVFLVNHSRLDLWLAVEGGVFGVSESHTFSRNDGTDRTEHYNQYAPEVGVGIGFDIRLWKGLHIGIEERAVIAFLKTDINDSSIWRYTEFGVSVWGFNGFITLSYHFGL